ncbi:MAG: hypothetical protein A2428_10360 [Bdellovibrionales bacterium RIFOXYC1_FULL_54_43]|nr:MAG: hypothetical protein A2428_10360 [Bdellovibrionales bacterium RIFOXYC1_FULL_54_43]OFZ80387.1 MAG: hypothetical protein A2603_13485 [Bdellovibrionales bacterium RIFOXYD1_FULL_55_31]
MSGLATRAGRRLQQAVVQVFFQVVLLLLVCVGPVFNSHAGDCARKQLKQLRIKNVEATVPLNFWKQNQPMLLTAKDGSKVPLTFSHDSEIGNTILHRLLRDDPEGWAALKEAASRYTYPIEQLMREFGLSRKQFIAFALRKGVDPSKPLTPTDLNAFYFAVLWDKVQHSALNRVGFNVNRDLVTPLKNAMARKGLNLAAHIDGGFVEFTHPSSEQVPRVFADEMRKFYKATESAAEVHLHVGLPARAINRSQGLAIARALETKVVLGLARRYSEVDNVTAPSHNVASNLWNNELSDRGLVYYKPGEFKEPVAAHDLELRLVPDLEEGMEQVEFVAQLAQRAGRLDISGESFGATTLDRYVGNLSGALEYAARALANSGNPNDAGLASGLRELASRAQERLSPAMRKEISKFLAKNNVESRLTPELFLKPE